MTGYFARLLTYFLKKSTDGPAKTSIRGMTGSIGLPILFLPLVCIGISSMFGWFALQDPDQDARLVGLGLAGAAGMLFLYFVHLASYRVLATDKALITGSLLSRERVIHLQERFEVREGDEGDSISIHQGGTRIVISWVIRGHWDFQDLISEAHRQLDEG